ncbi:hypothetical protein BH23PLA1_BH23PLA1_11820 [soil metagenome]
MRTRRSRLLALTVAFVALGVVVLPALAAELLGTVKTVHPDENKIVVTEKGTDKDVEVTITNETVVINAKGEVRKKFDLAKFKEKAEGKARVKVEHEDGVASKIYLGASKKQENDRP